MDGNLKASSFNEVALHYNEGRVGYPDSLYEVIDKNVKLNAQSKVLELGCGNGLATKEIYATWKPRIIAIDPGKALIQLARKSTHGINKIEYTHTALENFHSTEWFDAIFSATAFHWMPKESKYRTVHGLLKNHGALILYWNNYGFRDEQVQRDIQGIYTKHHPRGGDLRDIKQMQRERIHMRRNELAESGYFELTLHHEEDHFVDMDSKRYISLLKSFSNNFTLTELDMNKFYSEIAKYILSRNDSICLSIKVNLEIGGKSDVPV